MPIEIRELVVRISVTPDDQSPVIVPGEISFDKIKKQIVRECVEQVIIKLDKRTER